jgi:hypothetical protein
LIHQATKHRWLHDLASILVQGKNPLGF